MKMERSMSKSNIAKYREFTCKVLNRLDRDVRMWYKEHGVDIPSYAFSTWLVPLSIRFIKRGRFTSCLIRGLALGQVREDVYTTSGIGFAHRMQHDKDDPEVGRKIALKRAIHDALAMELVGIKYRGNEHGIMGSV